MTNLFLQILNASITTSWLIGAVVLVRFVVKRTAPRWIVCLLWGLVAVRLVLPFEVESSFSLVPDTPKITLEESIEASAEPEISLQAPPVEQLGNTSRPAEEISHDSTPEESIPEESTEESMPEESTEESVPEISTEESLEESTEESFEESMDTSTETSTEISTEISAEESVPTVVGSVTNPPSAGDSGISTATVAGIVWLCGLVALAVYALVNYLLLKKQVAIFVPDKRGFRRCEFIDTPFVLGFFRPRIYLPYGLSSAYEPYILAHEQAHIRRLDHLVKPVAYLVLALHWFNPLVWLSFVLFCKDIEYACDEKVLKNAAADIRKDYASALLECASKRSFLAACPIAFGEVSVKERVKTTMSYKKPFLWVMILCIILCTVVAVLFCTSPADTEGTSSQEQSTENVLETSSEEPSSSTEESDVSQLTSTDESRSEVSDDTSTEESNPPEQPYVEELELPEERETTAELVSRFEIGTEDATYQHSVSYNIGLEEDGWLSGDKFYHTDEQGNYYYAQGRALFRLSDGAVFSFFTENQLTDVLFYEQKLYLMDIKQSLHVFDISGGFENPVLLWEKKKIHDYLNSSASFHLQSNRVYIVCSEHITKACSFYDAESLEPVDPPYGLQAGASLPVEWKEDGTVILRKDAPYDDILHAGSSSALILLASNGNTYHSQSSQWYERLYMVINRDGSVASHVKYAVEYHDKYVPCQIGYIAEDKQYFIKSYQPFTIRINELVFENVLSHSLNWQEDGSLRLILIYPSYGEVYHIQPGVTHDGFTPVTDENDKKPEKPVLLRVEGLNLKDMDDLLSDSGIYNDQWSHKITSYHDTKCEGVYIRTDLLDLTKDYSAMETYLESLGVSCQVTAITGLICDLAPFTLKIDTADGEPYFLLVKDNGDSYTYTLMTLDEYRASYQRVEGKLVVNGVEIDASPAPYIYGDTGHLPVLAIMKALGATVEGDATDIATVTLDGVTFEIVRFDLAIWWGDKSFPGGVSEICLYFTDGDMMLHQTEFQHFLDEAFPGIQIRIDGETDTVYVTK